MKAYEIIIVCLVIIWVIANPYLRRFKIYEYCILLVMPFVISYLFFESIQNAQLSASRILLMFLLISGLIYQAIKFYRANILSSGSE
jgi:hypothetical protein